MGWLKYKVNGPRSGKSEPGSGSTWITAGGKGLGVGVGGGDWVGSASASPIWSSPDIGGGCKVGWEAPGIEQAKASANSKIGSIQIFIFGWRGIRIFLITGFLRVEWC
jgi:hypothetical protein